jgi:trehalose-6-phosphate hydrolase
LKVDYKDGDKWSEMDFDFMKLKELFNSWQTEMDNGGGWNALFWCNHDQPRIVSRFGNDKEFHRESATMLATAIHMMKGTPYIYQGEEIGMTNAYFESIDKYRDVESLNYYDILTKEKPQNEVLGVLQKKSRDNSRTPMQWDSSKNAGFSTGTPWLGVCKKYKDINAEKALEDKNSVFYHYKNLVALRKEYEIIQNGSFEIVDMANESLYVYRRKYKNQELLVICNFYGKEITCDIDLEGYTLLNSNYSLTDKNIRPYEARVYIR